MTKRMAVLLVALAALAGAQDWRAMRDEANLPAPQQADRNLPPNVKWYLEQRDQHQTWQDQAAVSADGLELRTTPRWPMGQRPGE